MKKIVVAIVMLLGMVNVWVPSLATPVYAATAPKTKVLEAGEGGIKHVFELVRDIMNGAVAGGAALGVMWAGLTYLTAGDNEGKVAAAKKRLVEIFIGFLAYTLLSSASFLVFG